jgi:hypothetical protein
MFVDTLLSSRKYRKANTKAVERGMPLSALDISMPIGVIQTGIRLVV